MPNQRTIARELGLNQASVSLALRGDASISEKTRKLVIETAARLGYRPNAYVSSLMTHIRSGRPLRDTGCIALLFNRAVFSLEASAEPGVTFQRQLTGTLQRAGQLGFHTERFFLLAPGMSAPRMEGILKARGIRGLVLMAGHGPQSEGVDWSRYATATVAYGWTSPETHRVATDHRHQVDIAYAKLIERGHRRIGFCLAPEAEEGVNGAWTDRHLLWQKRLACKPPVPLFVGKPGETPAEGFRRWFARHKPEALITLIGHEHVWLEQMGLRVPDDLSLVCLNRPPGSRFSGMEENHEVIGATTAEIVINQILHNEYGLPEHPRLILIKGAWIEGGTLGAPSKRHAGKRSGRLSR